MQALTAVMFVWLELRTPYAIIHGFPSLLECERARPLVEQMFTARRFPTQARTECLLEVR